MTAIQIDVSRPLPGDKELLKAILRAAVEREAESIKASVRAATKREPEPIPVPLRVGRSWRVGLGGVLHPLRYESEAIADAAAILAEVSAVRKCPGGRDNPAPKDIATLQWARPELIAGFIDAVERFVYGLSHEVPGLFEKLTDEVDAAWVVALSTQGLYPAVSKAWNDVDEAAADLRCYGVTEDGLAWLFGIGRYNVQYIQQIMADLSAKASPGLAFRRNPA